MKYVLIRDDDINYFTKTEWLEDLYGPLLERGLPVNLSVIPRTKCNLPLGDPRSIYRAREHMENEPFIPPEWRGKGDEFETGENRRLVDFLRSFSNIEVAQHGFAHEYVRGEREFASNDINYLDGRIRGGRDMLKKAFGRDVNFFVSPWDYLSGTALMRLKKAGFLGISLYKVFREMRPPFFQSLFSCREKGALSIFGKFLIVTHPGYLFSRFNAASEIRDRVDEALAKADVVVVVNHHWEYFFDWGGRDEVFFNTWTTFRDDLLKRDDIEFLNFTTLYHRTVG